MTTYGPIQLLPPGLLGLLQLKSAGKNPHLLQDTYVPTIELRDWLFNGEAIDSVADGFGVPGVAISSSGMKVFSPTAFVVPNGEWWYVHHYSVIGEPMAAGDSINVAPAYISPRLGTQGHYVGQASGNIPGAANATQALAHMRDFWLPPGAELAFYVSQIVAAVNIVVSGYARYTKLPI